MNFRAKITCFDNFRELYTKDDDFCEQYMNYMSGILNKGFHLQKGFLF